MDFYRTFIALPVEAGEKTRRIIREMRHSLAGERISWVEPDRFHITLRFLGDTPAGLVKEIARELRKGIRSDTFPLFMSEPGSFGPAKHPRVLYIGWKPSERLESVHQLTEQVLAGCGVEPDAQPFRAHLTLGRIRGLKDPVRFHRVIERFRGEDPGEILVDQLVYFRSDLLPGGPVYTPITRVKFMDRRGPDQPL